ncbi:23S rRNA (uracil(1939)-C(5))-methyltransferase RlmD [Patescibacteria group bacterium]|nr:23S rRNA (uracil(1939)-C(5))-methyltransferase RlmD [Patescibacteria group bacterium]
MKIGHKINVTVASYDARGRGLAEAEVAENLVRDCVIPFTAIGDEIEATFVRRDHGFKVCKLEKILKPSNDRVKTSCPHAGSCGGCIWQHLDYKAQLQEKVRGMQSVFSKIEVQDKLRDAMPALEQLQYRNRMDFAVGWNGEIGLKEYGQWNRYVDLSTCLLLQPGAGEILQVVRDWMNIHDLQPWDVKFHSGDVRYVVIRDGISTKQRMVIVVIANAKRVDDQAKQDLIDKISKLDPTPTSLLIGEQPKIADLSYAESFSTLFGEPYITENVNDISYKIHPNSFFQTNTKMAALLQDVVLDAVEQVGTKNLLDLYCGLGFFGIAAAKKIESIEHVDGYELDAEAIELATQNAISNSVQDLCTFVAGEAENLEWKNINADTVILDPPRSGLHPRVIKTLLSNETPLNPETIIYVSCNYKRLEHELPSFMEKYEVEFIQPLDLFPQTRHVEVVVVLSRRP